MPVEVKGVIELRKALRKFAPDLSKQLTKEMGAALKPIVREARSLLPNNDSIISNWVGTQGRAEGKFPQYDRAIAARGITYKTSPAKANKRGFRSLATIFNKSAAGGIYETSGRKNPNSTFVRNLENKYQNSLTGKGKESGRVIFKAYEHNRGKAQDAVIKAINRATALFNARSSQ